MELIKGKLSIQTLLLHLIDYTYPHAALRAYNADSSDKQKHKILKLS
ncbi:MULTISPECIES: hypothetical protein [Fischerella]|nr:MULTISPECIES: hypothetical protein [Fischerella]